MKKNQLNQNPLRIKSIRYLVARSVGLIETLSELKFKEVEFKGSGTNKVQIFKRANKYVKVTYNVAYLYIKDQSGKEIMIESGGIINAEFLRFFANRSSQVIMDNYEENR